MTVMLSYECHEKISYNGRIDNSLCLTCILGSLTPDSPPSSRRRAANLWLCPAAGPKPRYRKIDVDDLGGDAFLIRITDRICLSRNVTQKNSLRSYRRSHFSVQSVLLLVSAGLRAYHKADELCKPLQRHLWMTTVSATNDYFHCSIATSAIASS